jgi:hypothetical protein
MIEMILVDAANHESHPAPCHAERSSEESEAILIAESKHPYPTTFSGKKKGAGSPGAMRYDSRDAVKREENCFVLSQWLRANS